MTRSGQKDFIIPILKILADAIAIECAFLLSYWLRFYSPLTSIIPVTHGIPPLSAYIEGSLLSIPLWIWLMKRHGLYKQRREVQFTDDFVAILKVSFFSMLILAGIVFFYREFSYSRVVFLLLAVNIVILLSIERALFTVFERWWYSTGHETKNILIVGNTGHESTLYEYFKKNPHLGYKPILFTLENENQDHTTSSDLATNILNISQTEQIETIIFSLKDSDHHIIENVVQKSSGLDIEIIYAPTMLEVLSHQVRIRHYCGLPFLTLKTPALTSWQRIIKRIFDIVFAGILFFVLSPLFFLIMLLIKLDSKGPIFYMQERVGLDGKVFKVFKFRSMKVDAEKNTGPVWAKKDDPRTTRVGKFLRRFSLDELPQLLNVLKGDMSLVGPRPERPFFVNQFKNEIPKYLDRHRVKSGMTGWAQVNGLRGNAPITERTKYDIYYIENWSLIFDIKIIFKTFYAVLFGKDAY